MGPYLIIIHSNLDWSVLSDSNRKCDRWEMWRKHCVKPTLKTTNKIIIQDKMLNMPMSQRWHYLSRWVCLHVRVCWRVRACWRVCVCAVCVCTGVCVCWRVRCAGACVCGVCKRTDVCGGIYNSLAIVWNLEMIRIPFWNLWNTPPIVVGSFFLLVIRKYRNIFGS